MAPGQVVLQLEPQTGTDVRVTNSINFGLMVSGTNNTGVTLAINGVAGGNAQVGTAVSEHGRIDHLHSAGCGAEADQRRADDDHQRRQPDSFDYPEHFGAESDSDSDLGDSDVVQCWIGVGGR